MPVTVEAAEIKPPVNKLPPVTLAVTVNAPSVPTEVMLVCAAVVNVPTMLVPDKLPPVMLPVALIKPPVNKLPPVMLAAEVMAEVAEIKPPVNKLPPVMLAVTAKLLKVPTEVMLV